MSFDRRSSEPFPGQVQNYPFDQPNYGCDMLEKLNNLRAESCLTDVLLCVGGEEFPCHRNVLSVCSPYFKAMFSGDMRESKAARISINEILPRTLKEVIDYSYTGHIEITVDNAQDLLAAATLFQYPDIVNACCKFLTNHINPSNCLGIEDFAQLHSCPELEASANHVALENFSVVVDSDEFLEIQLGRLLTYLTSDLIDVRSEETVYSAVMQWIKHDMTKRQAYKCALMEHIRLATLPLQFLEDVVAADPHMSKCVKCHSLMDEAKQYHETTTKDALNQRRRSMQTETFVPRLSTVAKEVMVLVGGVTSQSDGDVLNGITHILQSVEMYDPQKDKWLTLPDLPQPVSWCAVAAVDNDIYVTGGIGDGQRLFANVWKFESAKRRWREVNPLLEPRARHASTSLNGNLYVVGGITLTSEGKVVDVETIECLDYKTKQWIVIGQSPFPRKHSHIVPYRQSLIEIGGTQGEVQVQTMECYMCSEDAVEYSVEQFLLPESIQFAQIVVINYIFYIIWEDSKKVISLNLKKRTFCRLPDMFYRHIHGGATVLNGKIYMTGGLQENKPNRTTECYDPNTGAWSIVRSVRHARAAHGCVTIQMT